MAAGGISRCGAGGGYNCRGTDMSKSMVYAFAAVNSLVCIGAFGWFGLITVLGWLIAFKLTIWR